MEKAREALPFNAGDDGNRIPPSRRKRLTSLALIALLLMYCMTWGFSFGRTPVPVSIDQRVERILERTPLIGIH
jgi:hypothetical protein